MKKVRVRYAPSPTGYLHIGNARTAIFNYLYAKHHGGDFIIRIEDTDLERNIVGGEESQLNYLKWLGVEWDESVDIGGPYGPYRQLERLDIYMKYAKALMDMGYAYKCYCTSEELEQEREAQKADGQDNIHYSRKCLGLPEQDKPYAIRFKVPENTTYVFNDMVRGELKFESKDVGDWVMIKANGIPTYNFAAAIDDHLMEITHILRGEEHTTNTPRQMMVYQAFGWDIPIFGHMTLIVNEHKKKLSKRDASILQFIHQYADLGYLPDAMFNFISLLGWSPESNEEILTMDQIIAQFDEKRLSKSPAFFDRVKLAYINEQYIKMLDLDEFVELCMPHLVNAGIDISDMDWVYALCELLQERVSYGEQIVKLHDDFFSETLEFEEDALAFIQENEVKNTLSTFLSLLRETEFTNESIAAAIKETGKLAGAKGKLLFMPCRIATTGTMHGPELPKMLALIGKETVTKRLEQTLQRLNNNT